MKGRSRKKTPIERRLNPPKQIPRFEIDFDKVEKWEDLRLIFEVIRFSFHEQHKGIEKIQHMLKSVDENRA